jgi:hypothetical protein
MNLFIIKPILLTAILIFNINLYSNKIDSMKHSIEITLGTNVLYSKTIISTNYRHEISPWLINNSFNVGIDYNFKLTCKKNIQFGMNYYYSDCVLSSGMYNIPFYHNHSKVVFNGLELSNIYQYQVFKWLNINAGLSHYFRLSTKVQDKEMGREFKLLKPDNSVNINNYSIGLLAGAEFMFSKKMSMEFNYIRGLNHFFKFDKFEEITPKYRNQLMMLQLTLNYKL